MERKLLILCVLFLFSLAIVCVGVFYLFPDAHQQALLYRQNHMLPGEENESVISLIRDDTFLLDPREANGHNLRIEIPGDVAMEDIDVQNDIMHHRTTLVIPGLNDTYFTDFPMVGSSNRISEITFVVKEQTGILEIMTDKVYEMRTEAEGRFLYIDYVNLRDLYDYIVVVDAGHGGKDVGANTKKILEKDINLAMVNALKGKFDKEKPKRIGVFYTRLTDTSLSLDARVNFANEIGADLFLSIHQNSTASGRSSDIRGTEVMYRSTDETEGSRTFAQTCLSHLLDELGSASKGLVAADDILIVRKAQMPVALAEIGFITNEKERELLLKKEYQESVAKALYDAITESLL